MRWAVLVGGTGSNLRALLERGLTVNVVVSHREEVGALDIAQEFGVPCRVILPSHYPDRVAYDQALLGILREFCIEQIALAGFLRWLGTPIIEAFADRIINLHPSLLPSYVGLHAIERAFADRVLWSGVTVHGVDEGHDSGPILAQIPVAREKQDSLEEFRARIHQAEHRLYPEVALAVDRAEVSWHGHEVTYLKEDAKWMYGR